ncbi:MAG: RtcB family protein [Actinobacteria bacterium]|nr:RtcB family protein [Actinomycetota bacterium]
MFDVLERISKYTWRVPTSYRAGMRVPGIIYASEGLLLKAREDRAVEQVANVSFLPGVVSASYAMPDIHWGYGFPIGGVVATDIEKGVISPGGVGFDINCGVRLLKTDLLAKEVESKLEKIVYELARNIPKGVGSRGRIKINRKEMERLMVDGAAWAVKNGYGWPEDIEHIEEKGRLEGADPSKVSERVYERGQDQPGTLGGGNHFVEIQEVVEVFDEKVAGVFGLFSGQLVIMIHSGSRGVGHQTCSDYIKVMDRAVRSLGISIPDRQLGCAPIKSKEGRDYYSAMACAVNYAFVNREILAHWVRESFERVFNKSAKSMGMNLLYDVCHNIAKIEEHIVDGKARNVCVHRKGATRAFGPGNTLIPPPYRTTGQPVLVPGDMGSASYVLVGTARAMSETFGSTCHGAGRVMSRSQAKKRIRSHELKSDLESRGIKVIAGNMALLAEEAPAAYKDVSQVVEVCHETGISTKVAKTRPLGVLKG